MRRATWNTIFALAMTVAIAVPMMALAAFAMGPHWRRAAAGQRVACARTACGPRARPRAFLGAYPAW